MRCRVSGVSRGGSVNFDLEAARAHGVTVVDAPGHNASAVDEFAIGAILAETRSIARGREVLREGAYRGDPYRFDLAGFALSEMMAGVIGHGAVSRRVVRLPRVFGWRIPVHTPHAGLGARGVAEGVAARSFTTLLAESGIVTFHRPVTGKTTGLIGSKALATMKPGATIVDTAHGPLMDHEALASGHLRGAMPETCAVEPTPPDWPLLKWPNVTLSPHVAGTSRGTVRTKAMMAAEKGRRRLKGGPHAASLPSHVR